MVWGVSGRERERENRQEREQERQQTGERTGERRRGREGRQRGGSHHDRRWTTNVDQAKWILRTG